MKDYIVSSNQIRLMKHCIGFSKNKIKGVKYRKLEAYRNYFTTSDNDKELDDLVWQGLMSKRDFNADGANPQIYRLTKEGLKFLSEITGVEIIEGD